VEIKGAQYEHVLGNHGVHRKAQGHQGSDQGCKGEMRRYWNLMEDSRGTLGCRKKGLAIEGV
jgi:hypothetical protein